jgi:hypothetical protein
MVWGLTVLWMWVGLGYGDVARGLLRVTNRQWFEVVVERFERYRWVRGFGVLRFAQDDSKDNGNRKGKGDGNGNRNRNDNDNCNCNGNGNGNRRSLRFAAE